MEGVIHSHLRTGVPKDSGQVGLEVCIDSVQSAINARDSGASSVELCANLVDGGTTPSIGMVQAVVDEVGDNVAVQVNSASMQQVTSVLSLCSVRSLFVRAGATSFFLTKNLGTFLSMGNTQSCTISLSPLHGVSGSCCATSEQ
eukprot:SAG31_NODE_4900_length_2877_cov_2.136069_2_plen_144_part_00